MKKPGPARQRAFLAAFEVCGRITQAAKAAKIDRSAHYDWLDNDPTYSARFERALLRVGDLLVDEAVRRANEGVEEPLIWKGKFVYRTKEVTLCKLPDGREVPKDKLPTPLEDLQIVSERVVEVAYGRPLTRRTYSDGLLAKLLTGLHPKFKPALELTGKGGAPLEIITRLEAARRRNRGDK